jgi:hypothetical protein
MKMQRVTVRASGGPEQLTVETVTEAPGPDRGQVLIEEAAGVNYLDVYQRKGLSPVSLPFTPGLEGSLRVGGGDRFLQRSDCAAQPELRAGENDFQSAALSGSVGTEDRCSG